jgi:phosphatidylglycerol:prolipoprotein diacylglycerol transferase
MAPALMLGIAIGRIGCLLNGCCFGSVTDVSWGIVFPAGSPAHAHQVAHGETFLYGLKFDEVTIGERQWLTIAEVQPGSEAATYGLKPTMVLWSIAGKLDGEPFAGQPHTRRQAAELLMDLRRTTPEETIQFDFLPAPPGRERELVTCMLTPPLHSEVLPVHPTQIYSSVLALMLCGTLLLLGRLPFYQQRAGLVFASFMILYSVGRFFIEMIRTDEAPFLGTGLTVSQNVSIVVCLAGMALFVYGCRRKSGKV